LAVTDKLEPFSDMARHIVEDIRRLEAFEIWVWRRMEKISCMEIHENK